MVREATLGMIMAIKGRASLVLPVLLCVPLGLGSCRSGERRDSLFSLPDWRILESIGRVTAVSMLPGLNLKNLKLDEIEYRWHATAKSAVTTEVYSVEYVGNGTLRTNEATGGIVQRFERVHVEIRPDGLVERGGVSQGWFELLSSPGQPLRHGWTESDPVRGASFYPCGRQNLQPHHGIGAISELGAKAVSAQFKVPREGLQLQDISSLLVSHGAGSSNQPVFTLTFRRPQSSKTEDVNANIDGDLIIVKVDEYGEYTGSSTFPLPTTLPRH